MRRRGWPSRRGRLWKHWTELGIFSLHFSGIFALPTTFRLMTNHLNIAHHPSTELGGSGIGAVWIFCISDINTL